MGKKNQQNKQYKRKKGKDKKKNTEKIYGKETPRSIRIKLVQEINREKNKKELKTKKKAKSNNFK